MFAKKFRLALETEIVAKNDRMGFEIPRFWQNPLTVSRQTRTLAENLYFALRYYYF